MYKVILLLSVLLVSCTGKENKSPEFITVIDPETTFKTGYTLIKKKIDTSNTVEIILGITVENNSSENVMIKVPNVMFLGCGRENPKRYYYDDLVNYRDFDLIPTSFKYSDSCLDSTKNPLPYQLRELITDSIKRNSSKYSFDESAIAHRFAFIRKREKKIFYEDLTILSKYVKEKIKIFVYYDTLNVNFKFPLIPKEFHGYKKVIDDIKFDTCYFIPTTKQFILPGK